MMIFYFLMSIAFNETENFTVTQLWVSLFEKNKDDQLLIESSIGKFFIENHKWKELISICDLVKHRGLENVYELIIEKLTSQIVLDLHVYLKKSKEILLPEEESPKIDFNIEEVQRLMIKDIMPTCDSNILISNLAVYLPRIKVKNFFLKLI